MARNFFRRTSRRRVLAGLALLLGLWIALAPFTRPLPGGAPYTLEATPEIDCRSPLIGLLSGDSPRADVYTTPRPSSDDPRTPTTVDCRSRAGFRVGVGAIFLISGASVLLIGRRRD